MIKKILPVVLILMGLTSLVCAEGEERVQSVGLVRTFNEFPKLTAGGTGTNDADTQPSKEIIFPPRELGGVLTDLAETVPQGEELLSRASSKIIRAFVVFMGMTSFILLSLLFWRWRMGRRLSRTSLENSQEIKVLNQHSLGYRKELVIVEVAGESILLGVTDSHVSMIKTLPSLEDDEDSGNVSEGSLFSDIFDEPVPEEKSCFPIPHQVVENENNEFNFSEVQDKVLEKLKSMRSL